MTNPCHEIEFNQSVEVTYNIDWPEFCDDHCFVEEVGKYKCMTSLQCHFLQMHKKPSV